MHKISMFRVSLETFLTYVLLFSYLKDIYSG